VRLAPSLSIANRSRLSRAMLVDVLHALGQVSGVRGITVVSADRSVRRIAIQAGAHFLSEGKRRGLNSALRLALRDARNRDAPASLVLPSDIPLVTPHEITRLLDLSDGYSIAITPSRDGHGTNALVLRPPGVINPAFGANSFQRHLSIANRKRLSVRVVKSKGMALDLDEPADLSRISRLSLRNRTGIFLKALDKTRRR
jgi:2-phospho-L-lactate guanylyltransferase